MPRRIVGSDGLVTGIDVVDTVSGEERTIACDGVSLGITGCRAAPNAERYVREFPLPPELHWGVSAIDAA